MKQAPEPVQIAQIKITLRNVRPTVWRRVLVPTNVTMRRLHKILNATMGWYDSHLYVFEIAGEQLGNPQWGEGEWKNDARVQLSQVVRNTDKFQYDYDFGDGWRHQIVIEKLLEPERNEKYPLIIAGQNACPPEDCGGPYGYENLKEALANPAHPEHESMTEWLGRPFKPEVFGRDEINEHLLQRKKLPESYFTHA